MVLDIRGMNGNIYTDLTIAFPVTSARGTNCYTLLTVMMPMGFYGNLRRAKMTVKCQGCSKQCMKIFRREEINQNSIEWIMRRLAQL